MRLSSLLSAALLLVLAACGGGGGGSNGGIGPAGQLGVPAPTLLNLRSGISADQVVLQWAGPPVEVDGYEMEAKFDSGSFQKIHTGLIPKTSTDLTVTFTPTAPDCGTYVFRARASLAGKFSDYSNEASCSRGPNAPESPAATYDSTTTGVLLRWKRNTTGSDGLRIERADCDTWGYPKGSWTTLPTVDPSISTYLDRSVQEGGYYAYRITNLQGQVASPLSGVSYPVFVPLLAPVNFQVVAANGGLRLSWQNQSRRATQVLIRRFPQLGIQRDIASISPASTTYLDIPPILGYFAYSVVAQNGTLEAESNQITAATPNPPGCLSLSATPYNIPTPIDAAIRPNGSWVFANQAPFGVLSNNDPWASFLPANISRWVNPVLKIDRQGWPHMVYGTPRADNPDQLTLVHGWFDGSRWSSESMVSGRIAYNSAQQAWTYGLDSSGTPHLVVDHATTDQPYGGSSWTLSYVHKVNGTWIEESLADLTPSILSFGILGLTLDDSDLPHLLLGNSSDAITSVRTGPGAWSSSLVPVGMDSNYGHFLSDIWVDTKQGWVFYEATVDGNQFEHGLWVIQMKAGLWQSPILLGTRPPDGGMVRAAISISPDRTRLAALINTTTGLRSYHLDPAGWHETLIAPNVGSTLVRIGFDSSQKLHLLTSNSSGYRDFHE